MPPRRIVISGCSGGGKSTVIDELASQGFQTFAEAGRIIVRQEREASGQALPWVSPTKFAEKLANLAINQFISSAELDGLIFFDRSVIEPLAYARMQGIELPAFTKKAAEACRYDSPIFMVPPWEEIFVNEQERRHSFAQAVAEHDALLLAFKEVGYEVRVIPKTDVTSRVTFILDAVGG